VREYRVARVLLYPPPGSVREVEQAPPYLAPTKSLDVAKARLRLAVEEHYARDRDSFGMGKDAPEVSFIIQSRSEPTKWKDEVGR
jgi:hypothetical protein